MYSEEHWNESQDSWLAVVIPSSSPALLISVSSSENEELDQKVSKVRIPRRKRKDKCIQQILNSHVHFIHICKLVCVCSSLRRKGEPFCRLECWDLLFICIQNLCCLYLASFGWQNGLFSMEILTYFSSWSASCQEMSSEYHYLIGDQSTPVTQAVTIIFFGALHKHTFSSQIRPCISGGKWCLLFDQMAQSIVSNPLGLWLSVAVCMHECTCVSMCVSRRIRT